MIINFSGKIRLSSSLFEIGNTDLKKKRQERNNKDKDTQIIHI